ncbi:hypothetical protein F5884DRAFT_778452 [Xylogone sp. PMI_703]|nr:hypothetical protein F5884DRAFT_778452 [Xylogone sp. PMI_703]
MSEIHLDEEKLGPIQGKVALVTGGASGIGKAIVELLYKKGASVLIVDLPRSHGDVVPAEIKKRIAPQILGTVEDDIHERLEFYAADVTSWSQLRATFTHAAEKYGRIDFVFANAGIAQGAAELLDDQWDAEGKLIEPSTAIIDVNIVGVIYTAKLALSYFKQNHPAGGSLVISASSSSYNARPNVPLYSVTKHGVVGLMRALREIAPSMGVSVSCIAPGGTATGMVDAEIQKAMEARGIPVQDASYVATGAVLLASQRGWNGKSLTMIGSKATEVEGPLADMMPLWYGKHNVDLAMRAATVPINK